MVPGRSSASFDADLCMARDKTKEILLSQLPIATSLHLVEVLWYLFRRRINPMLVV